MSIRMTRSSSDRGATGGSRGMTLVELLIVLSIIAIVAAVAIPGYVGTLPLRRLKADAMDIGANMRYAQMNAVKRNRSVGIFFNFGEARVFGVNPKAYEIFVDSGPAGFDMGDARVKSNISLRKGIGFDADDSTTSTVTFSSNGGGTTASETVVITNGEASRSVVVELSGRVRIQ